MTLGWTTDTVTTDASRAIHYTLLWGLDGVVLRRVGKTGERVPFVNEATLRRRLEADDVPVFAIDPGLFEGDVLARATWLNEIDSFNDIASFCERFGVRTVLVGALAAEAQTYETGIAADALRQLGEAASRSGLVLAVRNEWGTGVLRGEALAELLARVNHPAIRADWRPFDAYLAGEDLATGLAALRGSLASLTVRDATPEGEPAIPGEGQIQWGAILEPLAADGWDGLVTLEMHGRPAGPFGLHVASALISAIRRAKRSAVP